MQRLVEAPWPGNVRQLRNLIESMVVLAPGTEIRASDIPGDILEGAPTVLPVLASSGLGGRGAAAGHELEFILRGLMDLRLQVEELRRRLDDRQGKVQVIEVPESALTPISIEPSGPVSPPDVIYRSGMTMADVERVAIRAALQECQGNRRQAAARLGIGERTLYRKIKEFNLA
jgi:transcriptional regulator of acetoin/glycerol metabolism